MAMRTTLFPVLVEVEVFTYLVSAPTQVLEEPVSMIRLSMRLVSARLRLYRKGHELTGRRRATDANRSKVADGCVGSG